MNTRKICFSRIIGAMFRNVSLLASALLLSPMVAHAAAVTLAWDANTEDDLAGYKIHYGTASHSYSQSIDVGDVTEYTLEDLDDGVTYYLAATAYDDAANESGYSVELVHTTTNPNNNPAIPSVPNSSASGYTQTNYTFSTTASDPDGDALEFQYDWDDGSTSDWGASSQIHAWAAVGNFCVKAQAKDPNGALSGWSDCKSITITENTHTIDNQPPIANAGPDQTANEGAVVKLKGNNSSDPDGSIAAFLWSQISGPPVHISNSGDIEANFTSPNVVAPGETLVFELIVTDNKGLQATDSCSVYVTREAVTDSDGDGVPDDQDDFPYDMDEYLDTDDDGYGNNADTDDDNDGMPDTWELLYGLDPLKDDAAADPDGDEISNINEYNLGSEPNYNESNFAPDPPQLLNPGNDETVGLTPLLETDEFYDPNINDVHSQTQWKIIRVHDGSRVFDVTTNSSLTALKVPKLILEADTDYSWQVKFIDNQGTASQWSEAGYFTTEFLEQDSDGNGVLDHQEVATTIDLDGDGIMDRNQEDIKCVATETGDFKVGIRVREDEYADSIMSIQSETPADTDLLFSAQDGPNFLAFGLIHFKLAVKEPGDEVLVTIYLSKAAYDDGIWYKYDPVNAEWFDYSDYTSFSADRKTVELILTDGGFGDADGIANGVIVDPLALRTATDHSSGSDSFVEDIAENLDPTGMCFISSADSRPSDRQAPSLWSGIRSRELSIVFILMMFAYIGIEISLRIIRHRKIGRKTSLMEGWRKS
mgnify:CR=1 FL=1